MTSFNIVDLITNNPITKLTETHNNNFEFDTIRLFLHSGHTKIFNLFIIEEFLRINFYKKNGYFLGLSNKTLNLNVKN